MQGDGPGETFFACSKVGAAVFSTITAVYLSFVARHGLEKLKIGGTFMCLIYGGGRYLCILGCCKVKRQRPAASLYRFRCGLEARGGANFAASISYRIPNTHPTYCSLLLRLTDPHSLFYLPLASRPSPLHVANAKARNSPGVNYQMYASARHACTARRLLLIHAK